MWHKWHIVSQLWFENEFYKSLTVEKIFNCVTFCVTCSNLCHTTVRSITYYINPNTNTGKTRSAKTQRSCNILQPKSQPPLIEIFLLIYNTKSHMPCLTQVSWYWYTIAVRYKSIRLCPVNLSELMLSISTRPPPPWRRSRRKDQKNWSIQDDASQSFWRLIELEVSSCVCFCGEAG